MNVKPAVGASQEKNLCISEADDAVPRYCPRVLFFRLVATTRWVLETKSTKNVKLLLTSPVVKPVLEQLAPKPDEFHWDNIKPSDFSAWRCSRQMHSAHSVLPCCLVTLQIRARDDGLPVAHVALAVEGPGWADPDNVVLHVANAIIGCYDRTFGGGKVRDLGVCQGEPGALHCEIFRRPWGR